MPAHAQRLVAAFPPNVATLRVVDGTDHNSVSGEAEFWEALVNRAKKVLDLGTFRSIAKGSPTHYQ